MPAEQSGASKVLAFQRMQGQPTKSRWSTSPDPHEPVKRCAAEVVAYVNRRPGRKALTCELQTSTCCFARLNTEVNDGTLGLRSDARDCQHYCSACDQACDPCLNSRLVNPTSSSSRRSFMGSRRAYSADKARALNLRVPTREPAATALLALGAAPLQTFSLLGPHKDGAAVVSDCSKA